MKENQNELWQGLTKEADARTVVQHLEIGEVMYVKTHNIFNVKCTIDDIHYEKYAWGETLNLTLKEISGSRIFKLDWDNKKIFDFPEERYTIDQFVNFFRSMPEMIKKKCGSFDALSESVAINRYDLSELKKLYQNTHDGLIKETQTENEVINSLIEKDVLWVKDELWQKTTGFVKRLREISLKDSYNLRDDDTYNYRRGCEKSYQIDVSKLIKETIDVFSKEQMMKIAEALYKNDEFDDLSVSSLGFNCVLNIVYEKEKETHENDIDLE